MCATFHNRAEGHCSAVEIDTQNKLPHALELQHDKFRLELFIM